MPCISCLSDRTESIFTDNDDKRHPFPTAIQDGKHGRGSLLKRFGKLWLLAARKKSSVQKATLPTSTTESTIAAWSRVSTPTKYGKQQSSGPTLLDELYSSLQDQAEKIQTLEEDNHNLKISLLSLTESFNNIQSQFHEFKPFRQPSLKWVQPVRPLQSPTKSHHTFESPVPQRVDHVTPPKNLVPPTLHSSPQATPENRRPLPVPESSSTSQAEKQHTQKSSEILNKNFKVTLDDPTWKVLPAALKKYHVNSDNWKNYAMFICYDSSADNRIERCLSYDEKPLLLFQKLRDAKKNPFFMLKHSKDVPSPLIIARNKQAARKSLSMRNAESTVADVVTQDHDTSERPTSTKSQPTLTTQDIPVTPNARNSNQCASTPLSDRVIQESAAKSENNIPNASTTKTFGYAIAIFPYTAEHDDEFDVTVKDTFAVLSRARGWWIVQRDPTGSGVGSGPSGWVPAGCLLGINVPVTSAVAEAKRSCAPTLLKTLTSEAPILPQHIDSTSLIGLALMDYAKKSDEELDLHRDDVLRAFKRYNHWSYVVKEENGDRGWVPSWFIGKPPHESGAASIH